MDYKHRSGGPRPLLKVTTPVVWGFDFSGIVEAEKVSSKVAMSISRAEWLGLLYIILLCLLNFAWFVFSLSIARYPLQHVECTLSDQDLIVLLPDCGKDRGFMFAAIRDISAQIVEV